MKTEPDGRMFPITDDSSTIVNVITRAAIEGGAEIRMRERVERVVCGRENAGRVVRERERERMARGLCESESEC